MRELKFKVWSDIREEYATEAELYMDGSVDAYFDKPDDVLHHENTDLVIEQYTGLKDKNGKEIYEGDIVKYDVYSDTIGVVKYDAPKFVLDNELGELFLKGVHQEVIGNIHENPELLEEEK